MWLSTQQLKKKKQAAKRKGISTEEPEGGTDPSARPAPEQEGDAIGKDDAEVKEVKANVKGVTESIPHVPSVDVEMLDASEVVEVEVEVGVGGGDMAVDPISSIEKDDGMVTSVAGDDLPVPPAAPTNGNLSSVVGPHHKKSVSFVLTGTDTEALVGGRSGNDDGNPGAKAVPPLPPTTLHNVCGAEVDKLSATASANEAFLHRNFSCGSNPEQVHTWLGAFRVSSWRYLNSVDSNHLYLNCQHATLQEIVSVFLHPVWLAFLFHVSPCAEYRSMCAWQGTKWTTSRAVRCRGGAVGTFTGR